ncbi:hypothetical protein E4U43_004793 [Claviceps pusilla]|uniref:Zn(2)-C6 fungal-type domain-containing protein n=1 Tax=Claviceps pusilla TaxID=123648 RepID=A0A9P7N3R6_9HYPO|nr:hypothetical protein E4U43_004793 [Claviceps pusilla]
MTAPLPQQTISVKDAAAVRKRKRRAPAGGAADDCFTCSKRNVKCDRRRPYCSQCLEFGNECSGYKTQLTWGVGVASRGKLRGLSLPIARAPPVSREVKKPPPVSCGRVYSTAAVTATHWAEQQEPEQHQQQQNQQQHQQQQQHKSIDMPPVARSGLTPVSSYSEPGHYDYFAAPTHHDPSPHGVQHSWGGISYSSSLLHAPDATQKYSRFPVPLMTDGLSSSIDSVSDVDYLSPLSQTYTRDDMSFGSGSPIILDGYPGSQHSPATHSPPLGLFLGHHHHHHQQQQQQQQQEQQQQQQQQQQQHHHHHPHPDARVPNPCAEVFYSMSEHSSGLDSHSDAFGAHLNNKLMRECDGLGQESYRPHLKSPHGPHGRDDDLARYNPSSCRLEDASVLQV